MHARGAVIVALTLAWGASAACQRTPEEPAPAPQVARSTAPPPPPTTAAPTLGSGASGGAPSAAAEPLAVTAKPVKSWPNRCVRPTPKDPPPAVPPGPAPGCPADPDHPGPLPVVSIWFPDSGATLKAELARSDPERERGLMYRHEMADDHGMLFRMDERSDHTFWMKNTCIPLDMLFIEDDGLIAGIYENVPTLNLDPRSVGCPSSWVLEVNAGWARRHGVVAGQQMPIPADARRL